MELDMFKRIAAALLLLLCTSAYAHDSDPVMDETPVMAAMRYCQVIGVRAAWGAQARFLGAPATFKYIAEHPLKKMFMGDAEIPHDAIYVLESMDLEQRKIYEEAAFNGWKAADRWVSDGRERPEFEVLAAIFYKNCKDTLTVGTSEE